MSFIPQRVNVGAPPATGASISGGSAATNQVAYFASATSLTGSANFTFDGSAAAIAGTLTVTNSSGPQITVKDGGTFGTNADPHLSFNDNAGAGGVVGYFAEASNNFYVRNSRATGHILFQTQSTTRFDIDENGVGAYSGTITVTNSSGPQVTIKDGGTFGTNADPHFQFEDGSASGGRIGFTDAASKDFHIQNQTDTGLFNFVTTATQIAGSAGAATGTYWTFKLGGTAYKVALLANS